MEPRGFVTFAWDTLGLFSARNPMGPLELVVQHADLWNTRKIPLQTCLWRVLVLLPRPNRPCYRPSAQVSTEIYIWGPGSDRWDDGASALDEELRLSGHLTQHASSVCRAWT